MDNDLGDPYKQMDYWGICNSGMAVSAPYAEANMKALKKIIL